MLYTANCEGYYYELSVHNVPEIMENMLSSGIEQPITLCRNGFVNNSLAMFSISNLLNYHRGLVQVVGALCV
jgi:hypothetical protein